MGEANQGLTRAEQERDGFGSTAGEASTVQAVVWAEGVTDPHLAGVRAITVDSPEWAEMIRERRATAEEARQAEMLAAQQESAQAAVSEAAGRYVIAAPAAQPGQVVGVGGVVFVDGVAVTDDLAVASYCRGAGYAVKDLHAPQDDTDDAQPDETSEAEATTSRPARQPRTR